MPQHAPVNRVIVIGTSTGGLSALRKVLSQLSRELDAAVFVTMHIGERESSLPEILANATSLSVRFASSGEEIRNGNVYIAPPDCHLLVEQVRMRLVRSAKENHTRPAIDPMFRSAAISYRNRTIGLILTGDLDDGVVGLQAAKAYGGVALVQDPATADAPSMPMSALRHVEVDACLPLDELGSAIVQAVELRPDEASFLPELRRIEPFATENELAADMKAEGADALDAIGTVSAMTCPECGGALWELGLTPPRYRCHTGHSYTYAALLEAQNGSIEESLWIAIRALHEKQQLLGRLAQSNRGAGRSDAAEDYELASRDLESHRATLLELLTRLPPLRK